MTIPITLPDDLAEEAKAKGLLSADSLALIVVQAIKNDTTAISGSQVSYPSDLDPRLKGAVNPLAFKRGKIIGDIVSPLDISWEACS